MFPVPMMPILGMRGVLGFGPGVEFGLAADSDVMLAGVYGDFHGRATAGAIEQIGHFQRWHISFTRPW